MRSWFLLEQKVKMNTVLEEIKYLRNMSGFEIDRRNNNRYRVLVKENIGRTAYCFSTPIYNVDSRKLINLTFDKSNDVYIFKGSNANVTVCKNRCVLENREGRAILLFDDIISASDSPNEINVAPCMNGLLFTVNSKYIKFNLKSEVKQSGVRFNSTCFSIMKDKFKPFLSLGTLYSTDQRGRFLPAEMKISHSAPSSIWVFSVPEESKVKISFTFSFSAMYLSPSSVRVSVMEAAANTINSVSVASFRAEQPRKIPIAAEMRPRLMDFVPRLPTIIKSTVPIRLISTISAIEGSAIVLTEW